MLIYCGFCMNLSSIEERPSKRLCIEQGSRISLDQTREIAVRVFPGFGEKGCRSLCERLNTSLQHPDCKIGSLFRFHKKMGGIALWCQKLKNGTSLNIIQGPLGKGNHKKVKTAVGVFIPKDGTVPVSFGSNVIYRTRYENDIGIILKGVKLHHKIFKLIPNAFNYYVPVPRVYPKWKGAKGYKLELEGPRYAGDLSGLVSDFYALTEDGVKVYPTPLDWILGLNDVALGLELLAGQKMSYQDAKLENILVKIEDGHLVMHISDFDRLVEDIPCLMNEEREESYFINFAARQGVATKETDCYSLALLIAESLIPNMRDFMFQGREIGEEIIESYRELIHQKEEKLQGLLKMQIETLKDLLPNPAHALLEPFIEGAEDLTQANEDLLRYAADLEQMQENAGSSAIRRFVTGLAISDKVFSLLVRVLKADLVSEDYEQEGSEFGDEDNTSLGQDRAPSLLIAAMEKALEAANFPTMDEIKQTLHECAAIAGSGR